MSLADLEARVDLAIEHVLMLSAPTDSDTVLASRLYDTERELMNELRRPWMVKLLVGRIHRRRNRLSTERQLPITGFESLPKRIHEAPPKPGEKAKTPKIWFGDATLRDLLAYRKELVKKRDAKVELLDRLIGVMRKHVTIRSRKTVAEVMEQYKFDFDF